jgi:hypothetical protein
MDKEQSTIDEPTFAVWTAMRQGGGQISGRTGSVERAGLRPAEHATNAAHCFTGDAEG